MESTPKGDTANQEVKRPASSNSSQRRKLRQWGSASTQHEKMRVAGPFWAHDISRESNLAGRDIAVKPIVICMRTLPGDSSEGGVASPPSDQPNWHFNQLYSVKETRHRIGCTIDGYRHRHRLSDKAADIADVTVDELRISNLDVLKSFLDDDTRRQVEMEERPFAYNSEDEAECSDDDEYLPWSTRFHAESVKDPKFILTGPNPVKGWTICAQ